MLAHAVFTPRPRHPWRWAAIHGIFVAGLAVANLISWRANERSRAATGAAPRNASGARSTTRRSRWRWSRRAGRVLQGNRELRERTGHERPEGLWFWDFVPAEDRDDAARELAARVRRARDRAPLRARRRHDRLDPVAPLADPRRRRPPGPLHLPGRRHHRPQARRRAARPPGPPRPAHRPAEPRAVRPRAGRGARAPAASSAARSPSCSPTSTTSRSSTTRSATAPATSCWSPSPSASPRELRPDDVIARFGGDEFVILLERVEDLDDVRRVADRLAAAIREPFVLDGQQRFVSASFGIALADGDEVVRRGPAARRRRRHVPGQGAGQGAAGVLRRVAAHARASSGSSSRPACATRSRGGQLELHYQPEIALADGAPVRHRGAAALAAPGPRHDLARAASSRSPSRAA